ncbi:family 5 glycoside hydrolase family 13/glycosyltransferase protein [Puccinia sorghi]|uniref:Family 5 glycoside hydrolase family 13/glycosyltransferase protein n=1 Tax=Puccinia sorghi TaxID=27349 RepID=A0A0L6UQU7_9BASI|nr:family 5 glycoside hydrolase family 13/glycosyltransferase protein [Puccinia sorghi]
MVGSQSSYYLDGMAPCRGCLQSITKDHLGFKVLVLVEN